MYFFDNNTPEKNRRLAIEIQKEIDLEIKKRIGTMITDPYQDQFPG